MVRYEMGRTFLGLALAGTLAAVIAAACGGDDSGEASPPPTQTPSTTASPTPGPTPTIETIAGEGSFDWQVLEIDRGVKPDLALDAGGRAHIAFGLEARGGFVKHALIGDSTVTSTVAEGYFYFPLAIAVNDDGVPWIAFHNHDYEDQAVALAQDLETGDWLVLRTKSPGHDGWDNSLALDANGRPHTVSVDPSGFRSNVGLEYGFFDANNWTVEEVGTGPLMYEFGTAIGLDSAGNPHATYYNDVSQDLMYASRSDGAWTVSAIDTEGDVGRFADMHLDAADRPHVAYLELETSTSGTIKYAVLEGGTWRTEAVDTIDSLFVGPPGNMSGARSVVSLALDSQGNPVIAYSDQESIKLAWQRDGQWQVETVQRADGDPLGQTVSLALDASDTPHLTYYVATDLREGGLDGVVFYLRGVSRVG